jgi:4-carboxymuconolactone decarboxylase
MDLVREKGLEILRKVFGEKHFEKRTQSTNSFNRELRALIEEYCFGRIWGREGLDAKTRSMLVITTLTALGKGPELKLHILGALNNGCTVDQIKEVLLQATVYCGLPAGVQAFKATEEVLSELNLIET